MNHSTEGNTNIPSTKELANLIYPKLKHSTEEYEYLYPQRDLPSEAKVTRLGPSPTGMIHLGNLYGAFVDERLAHQSKGIFYLRIEDTDEKRYVENAVETIISSLDFFDIRFDEGVTSNGDSGNYGPYTQSLRKEIYQSFAYKLLCEGKAYPCFMTEDEISEIREKQENQKLTPGIYSGWSKFRDWNKDYKIAEEVIGRIKNGDNFVIRLKSKGTPNPDSENTKRFEITDAIRGKLSLPVNFQDVIIIKQSGIPTYHFAHVVDDHLMRTTHVVRGEEWLPSLPMHIELFEALGFEPPIYCHTAQLMKLGEDGNKRKLSKRHDPELSLDYYRNQGYHPDAVREYLMTILNSNFEEWRESNPDASIDEFDFDTEKMPVSGSLFDLNKLNDVSKRVLLGTPAENIANWLQSWSNKFAPEYAYMFKDMKQLQSLLDIGRRDARPRADLMYAKQIVEFISYFYDESFEIIDEYPKETISDLKDILDGYLNSYNEVDDNESWFDKVRNLAVKLGYASKPKDYKKNPDDYKGHVGHVSQVIRIAIVGRSNSPDLWTIQQLMGKNKVENRIKCAINNITKEGRVDEK